MEIRNEELNNSKRSRRSGDDTEEEGGRSESLSTPASSRPSTTLPPAEEILEKDLFDAVFWRKQSLANKDMVCLVFIMMLNSKQQEVVGKIKGSSAIVVTSPNSRVPGPSVPPDGCGLDAGAGPQVAGAKQV